MLDLTIPTPHGQLPITVERPSTDGPWPGVVVIHDAGGMSNDTRRQVEWLASEGFVAAAPNLFHWGSTMRCLWTIFGNLRSGQGRSFDEVEAARTWLAEHAGSKGRVGVIGFCMGGGFALALAPGHGFAASSVNYGVIPANAETVLADACPIVASYGRKDRSLRGAATKLARILDDLEVDYDVKEYPDAGHSFLNDHSDQRVPPVFALMSRYIGGAEYHEPSAVDARRRIIAFFRRHLEPGA